MISMQLAIIASMPRYRALAGPTPLEEAKALSRHLGGPRIFLKRDDLTAVGLGGNKVRKLEFIIGRVLAEGGDTLIVIGGYQSNLARIATAMAIRAGLKVELVLGGVPGESRDVTGNLLLSHLLGANIHYVETEPRWEFGSYVDDLAARLENAGRKVAVMPLGGATPEGIAGYVLATAELMQQFEEQGIAPSRLIVSIGSGGTYCGLVLGECNLSPSYKVTGISVSRPADYLRDATIAATAAARDALGLSHAPTAGMLDINDAYIGDHYGALTDQAREAIQLVARLEGIFLDPVYSGKGMSGLIGLIRSGEIGPDETVVFLHTGGSPALFAYDAARLLAS